MISEREGRRKYLRGEGIEYEFAENRRKGRRPITYVGEVKMVDLSKLEKAWSQFEAHAARKLGRTPVMPTVPVRDDVEKLRYELERKRLEKEKYEAEVEALRAKRSLKELEAELSGDGAKPDSLKALKLEIEKLKLEKEKVEAERELERVKGTSQPPKSTVIVPVYRADEGVVELLAVRPNPGETEVIETIKVGEKKKEEKAEVEKTAAVKAVEVLGEMAKKGGEPAPAPGAVTREEVKAKIEAVEARMEAKLTDLKTSIINEIRKLGGKKPATETDVLTKLHSLGLLKKESFVDQLKALQDMGLVRVGAATTGTMDERILRLRHEMRKSDKAFLLALRRMVNEDIRRAEELKLGRERINLLRNFAKDIGEAIAEATEEMESETTGAPKGELKVGKKTKSGAEIYICDLCNAEIPVAPEAQKEGNKIACSKCGTVYTYSGKETAS